MCGITRSAAISTLSLNTLSGQRSSRGRTCLGSSSSMTCHPSRHVSACTAIIAACEPCHSFSASQLPDLLVCSSTDSSMYTSRLLTLRQKSSTVSQKAAEAMNALVSRYFASLHPLTLLSKVLPQSCCYCLQVQYREEYKSFTHFLTSVCAIVGGVFTVSGLIDSFIYHGQQVSFIAACWCTQ